MIFYCSVGFFFQPTKIHDSGVFSDIYLRIISNPIAFCLYVLGLKDTSTLVGHFVLYPRERGTRDRRDSRGNEREGQGRKEN